MAWITVPIIRTAIAVREISWWAESMPAIVMTPAATAFPREEKDTIPIPVPCPIPVNQSVLTVKP